MQIDVTLKSLPLILWLGGLYYFFPALILACVFLFVPVLRRHLITRAIGIFFAIVAAIFPLAGLALVLQFGAMVTSDSLDQVRRTHHLRAPATLAGILFPAGSDILIEKDHPNFIQSGKVPVPTPVRGFMLIGDFIMTSPDSGEPGSLAATLAQPATIAGIPCAAAAININSNFTSCILARNFSLSGFDLQAGTFIQARRTDGVQQLEQGTLAAPTSLVDTIYPAGTILQLTSGRAETLAHLDAIHQSPLIDICLTTGSQVEIGGATLRGPFTLQYGGATMNVTRFCNLGAPGAARTEKGMPQADLNGTPFTQGTFTFATGKWDGLSNDQTPEME